LGQIRRIQQYAGINTRDPETGPYRSEFCKLVTSRGRPIYFRNGIYLRPAGKMSEFAINQAEEYATFVIELKRGVARLNTKATVVSGWLLASLAWWCNALVGFGLMAMGVGIFFTDSFFTALLPGLFCLIAGGFLFCMGIAAGRGYWPQTVPVTEDLTELVTGSAVPPHSPASHES
jgi:hypothetical protein